MRASKSSVDISIFKAAVAQKNARADQAAMLEDRILLSEGKNQVYGTQVRSGPDTGGKTGSASDRRRAKRRCSARGRRVAAARRIPEEIRNRVRPAEVIIRARFSA
jgi:hypothetical protein